MTQIGKNLIAGELLRGFVERIENVDSQIKELADDKAVIMAEAKKANLVPAGIKYIVKQRKLKPSERAEAESLRDMYLHAMGMGADNPLFRAVGLMKFDVASRESVIEAMKQFVPSGGSIEIDAGGGPKVRLSRASDGSVSVTEVVEKPISHDAPDGSKQRPAKPEVPTCSPDEAEKLGRAAFRSDVPVISNPFPYGDARRPRWDRGWREEGGNDGMGD